jgi:hypothetical protein
LTPENYDKIVEKVALLVIDTAERLSGCIEIMFEKVFVTFDFKGSFEDVVVLDEKLNCCAVVTTQQSVVLYTLQCTQTLSFQL